MRKIRTISDFICTRSVLYLRVHRTKSVLYPRVHRAYIGLNPYYIAAYIGLNPYYIRTIYAICTLSSRTSDFICTRSVLYRRVHRTKSVLYRRVHRAYIARTSGSSDVRIPPLHVQVHVDCWMISRAKILSMRHARTPDPITHAPSSPARIGI